MFARSVVRLHNTHLQAVSLLASYTATRPTAGVPP